MITIKPEFISKWLTEEVDRLYDAITSSTDAEFQVVSLFSTSPEDFITENENDDLILKWYYLEDEDFNVKENVLYFQQKEGMYIYEDSYGILEEDKEFVELRAEELKDALTKICTQHIENIEYYLITENNEDNLKWIAQQNEQDEDCWYDDEDDISTFFQDDEDVSEDIDWDTPRIDGKGTARYISYGYGDHLIQLRLFVNEDSFEAYIEDMNPDGGEQRKVVVRDLTKLMTVLSVTNPEDLIDALMEKCMTVEEPLSVGRFFGLLKKNGLEYDEQVIGEYIEEYDDEDNPICTYHPIETGNE